MMIPLATEVRTQIADFKRLQSSATQVASIQATAAALEPVIVTLARWTAIFPALELYFDVEQGIDLREQAAALYRHLRESRDKFATEFNQHTALTRIQTAVHTLEEKTQQYWNRYAAAKLQAPREHARFAQLLPHMQPAMPAIETAVADLQRLADRMPARPTDIEAFHTKLAQLDALLQNMTGMDAQQTAFLTKLGNGTATLVDISPALLEWCQREELAPRLKISL